MKSLLFGNESSWYSKTLVDFLICDGMELLDNSQRYF